MELMKGDIFSYLDVGYPHKARVLTVLEVADMFYNVSYSIDGEPARQMSSFGLGFTVAYLRAKWCRKDGAVVHDLY